MTVQLMTITAANVGQRIDNFLLKPLKGLPTSRLYRLLRKGEVRVNKKRIGPDYRLQLGDIVRIPPVRLAPETIPTVSPQLAARLVASILYQDARLLVLNKPAGVAVHAGSGVEVGVIEILRVALPALTFLELAHRLDKETSGCLILAKDRQTLLFLHDLFKTSGITKRYQALVHGVWPDTLTTVNLPLTKGQVRGGEYIVTTDAVEGKASMTTFTVLQRFPNTTLIEAVPHTGRTHQIRVHTAAMGFPIVGDEKYGRREQDKALKVLGAKGLYLHAAAVSFSLPESHKTLTITAELPIKWQPLLQLTKNSHDVNENKL